MIRRLDSTTLPWTLTKLYISGRPETAGPLSWGQVALLNRSGGCEYLAYLLLSFFLSFFVFFSLSLSFSPPLSLALPTTLANVAISPQDAHSALVSSGHPLRSDSDRAYICLCVYIYTHTGACTYTCACMVSMHVRMSECLHAYVGM